MKDNKKDFIMLDDSDFKILFMLIRRSGEFSKLDFPDQKVLVWFLVHSHKRVKSWIDYLAENYNAQSPNTIDGSKLYSEIDSLFQD